MGEHLGDNHFLVHLSPSGLTTALSVFSETAFCMLDFIFTLKMKVVHFAETLEPVYQNVCVHVPW